MLVFYIVILTGHVIAETSPGRYWVLGSYVSPVEAAIERQRLERHLGQVVQIAKFQDGSITRLRLVIPNTATQKAELMAAGIDAWNMVIKSSETSSSDQKISSHFEFYLVLASYADQDMANLRLDRLRKQSGESLTILKAHVNETAYYRLALGPYSGMDSKVKAKINRVGINNSWWLRLLNKNQNRSKTLAKSIKVPEEKIEALVKETEVPEKKMVAIRKTGVLSSHVSYIDYCTNRATSTVRKKICSSDKFVKQIAWRLEVKREEIVSAYCATLVNRAERLKYCSGG